MTDLPQEQAVRAGAYSVTETLRFTFTGQGSTISAASLKVLSPSVMSSPPVEVRYSCP